MSTIRDVAKEAGLSTGTISKALSDPKSVSAKSYAKVEAAIKKLNYTPNMLAQQFRAKSSNTIVVLVPDISNLFFAKVIRGIEKVAQDHGYSVLLGDTGDSITRENAYIRMVETKLADGIINLRPYAKGDSALPKEGIVSVGASSCENTPYPCVRIDNKEASFRVVNHLLSLGHKHIGLITGLKENPHTIDRLKGFKQALQESDIVFDESLLVEGDFCYWSGLNAAEYFARLPKIPTAIFCMNDEMAIGLIKGLTDKGFNIPEDISITGFDDSDVCKYFNPTITTVAQPAEKIGMKSAELLIDLLSNKQPKQTEYILPYEFIARDSTNKVKVNES